MKKPDRANALLTIRQKSSRHGRDTGSLWIAQQTVVRDSRRVAVPAHPETVNDLWAAAAGL
jgi:hypothetical protein